MPFASIQALFEGSVSNLEELAPLFYKEISAPHTIKSAERRSNEIDQAERDIDRLPLLIRVAKGVVADIKSWTDEQATELAYLDYQNSLHSYNSAQTKAELSLGIIIEAEDWNPTTTAHQRFKEILVDELSGYVSEFDSWGRPRKRTAAEYKATCLSRAKGNVSSYEFALKCRKELFNELDSACEDLSANIRTHSTHQVKS